MAAKAARGGLGWAEPQPSGVPPRGGEAAAPAPLSPRWGRDLPGPGRPRLGTNLDGACAAKGRASGKNMWSLQGNPASWPDTE